MTVRDRDGLVARIRQMRRAAAIAQESAPAPVSEQTALEALQERVAHLEALVEGLQDSIYREAERQGRQIAEIQAQIEPATMSAALSKDARERGLQ